MTGNYYKSENYKVDHTTFGGVIYSSDYNTESRSKFTRKGSSIASRIIADKNFDKQCRINKEIIKSSLGNSIASRLERVGF